MNILNKFNLVDNSSNPLISLASIEREHWNVNYTVDNDEEVNGM